MAGKKGMKILIFIVALLLVLLWYVTKAIKKNQQIEIDRMNNHLRRILFYIDKPTINIFYVSTAQVNKEPYSIEIIKKFNDFTLLSDFAGENIDIEKPVDNDNIFLIPSSLKAELIRYKNGFLKSHLDLVKLGYLYAYLGKPDKNYEDSHEYLAECQKKNDILEEEEIGKLPREIRYGVFERDNWHCVLCGERFAESLLHVHHVKYRSRGGGHELENLVTLCRYCHAGLPFHYKIPEKYRIDFEQRNKKIILNIYKKKPDVLGRKILSNNPLRNILDKKVFVFEEEALSKRLCFVIEPYCFVKVFELERESYFIYQASKNFSIDSPLGKALMGSGIGETVEVEVPGKSIRTLKIQEIILPERVDQHDICLMSWRCEKCHVKLKIPHSYKKLRCPKCGHTFC